VRLKRSASPLGVVTVPIPPARVRR
jgi:hypothetical protein